MSRRLPAYLRPTVEQLDGALLELVVGEAPGFEHSPTGPYAVTYWTPLLGPSCMALARFVLDHPDERWPAETVARCIGLRLAHLVTTAHRLRTFGLGGIDVGEHAELAVLGTWPPLSSLRQRKLPEPLAWLHDYELGGVHVEARKRIGR